MVKASDLAVPVELQSLFERLSPPRFRSPLAFPRLAWHTAWNYRRDRSVLAKGFADLMGRYGGALPDDVLDWYLNSVILLHYVQHCQVRVLSMMKPELMENLVQEAERIIDKEIPGDFVDVGVWKGGSSMVLKTVNDLKAGGRAVFLLDVFDTMDHKVLDADEEGYDRAIIEALEMARKHFGTEGVTTSVSEVQKNFESMAVPLDNVHFVEGNLVDPAFPFDRVGKIALLRVDCDFYTATARTMEALYPRISPGGTIILDDYYLEAFGERRAADEYREKHGIVAPIRRVGQSAIWHIRDQA